MPTHNLQTPKQLINSAYVLFQQIEIPFKVPFPWKKIRIYAFHYKGIHCFPQLTAFKFHNHPPLNIGRVLVNVPFISSQQKVSFVSPYTLSLISAIVSNSKTKTKASQKLPIPSSGIGSSTSESGDKRKYVFS